MANLNNPSTSDESKQHSKEVLEQEFDGGKVGSSGDENPQNVAGGLKAYVSPSSQLPYEPCFESRKYYQEPQYQSGGEGECRVKTQGHGPV